MPLGSVVYRIFLCESEHENVGVQNLPLRKLAAVEKRTTRVKINQRNVCNDRWVLARRAPSNVDTRTQRDLEGPNTKQHWRGECT